MLNLLDRTRLIGDAVGAEGRMGIDEIVQALAHATESSVLVANSDGRAIFRVEGPTRFRNVTPGSALPPAAAASLAALAARTANSRNDDLLALLDRPSRAAVLVVVPLRASGRRLGNLVLSRDRVYDERDLVVVEYAATVIALEMRAASGESQTDVARRQTDHARTALSALSYSEIDAIAHILGELKGPEGIVVASRVADRVRITRSVIVNALRKLESGLIIQSRSLGMKGTYIKVINPRIYEELEKLRTG
jgi:transcriptional pleiotropic repressor